MASKPDGVSLLRVTSSLRDVLLFIRRPKTLSVAIEEHCLTLLSPLSYPDSEASCIPSTNSLSGVKVGVMTLSCVLKTTSLTKNAST